MVHPIPFGSWVGVVRWIPAWVVGLAWAHQRTVAVPPRLTGLGLRAGRYHQAVRHLSIDLVADRCEEALAVRNLLIVEVGAHIEAAAVRPGALALQAERHNEAAVWHSPAGFLGRGSVSGTPALAVGQFLGGAYLPLPSSPCNRQVDVD